MSPVAMGSGEPSGLEDSPQCLRARKPATCAESQYRKRSALYSGGRARWKRQMLPQAGSRAPGLLLSRISISLAPQSMGSMGALITAITNPCNHAASRPKGREPSGSNRHYPKSNPGSQITASTNQRNHAASRPKGCEHSDAWAFPTREESHP